MRIVIDLDHTICIPDLTNNDSFMRYGLAAPIRSIIERMVRWKARGDYIIIHTARRMKTHNGELSKIEADIGEITRTWLCQHNVPYDELVFGKPFGDWYCDDKAICIDQIERLDSIVETS